MKVNTLLMVTAVVFALFGLALIFIPGVLIGLLGGMPMERPSELLMAADLFGFAVLNWLARGAEEGQARRAILLGNLVAAALGLIFTLYLQLTGIFSPLGWVIVLIYLVFTAGFAYFLFLSPGRTAVAAH